MNGNKKYKLDNGSDNVYNLEALKTFSVGTNTME